MDQETRGSGKQRRKKRAFTDEFRADAVRLVIDEGETVPEVARDLDLTASALRVWVDRARADRGKGRPGVLTTAEREELARLRKEVRELRTEHEILSKAAVRSIGQRNGCYQPHVRRCIHGAGWAARPVGREEGGTLVEVEAGAVDQ